MTLERVGAVTSINRRTEATLAPTASLLSLTSIVASATPVGETSAACVPSSDGPGLERVDLGISSWESGGRGGDGREEGDDKFGVHLGGGEVI